MANRLLAPSPVCRNCGSESIEKYCCKCGQKTHNKRFTLKGLLSIFWEAFDIEKGLLYAVKMLFVAPGVIVNDYLNGKTKAYFNPLNYALICAGLYAIVLLWFGILDMQTASQTEVYSNYIDTLKQEDTLEATTKLIGYVKQYMNIISVISIPFISLASTLYFRKSKLLYGEHLIIISFVYAQGLLIMSIILPLVLIFPSGLTLFTTMASIITYIYYIYAFKKTFKYSLIKSIGGGIIVPILGQIFFTLFIALITLSVLFILNNLFNISIKDLL